MTNEIKPANHSAPSHAQPTVSASTNDTKTPGPMTASRVVVPFHRAAQTVQPTTDFDTDPFDPDGPRAA